MCNTTDRQNVQLAATHFKSNRIHNSTFPQNIRKSQTSIYIKQLWLWNELVLVSKLVLFSFGSVYNRVQVRVSHYETSSHNKTIRDGNWLCSFYKFSHSRPEPNPVQWYMPGSRTRLYTLYCCCCCHVYVFEEVQFLGYLCVDANSTHASLLNYVGRTLTLCVYLLAERNRTERNRTVCRVSSSI